MTSSSKYSRWELPVCALRGHATFEPTDVAGGNLAKHLRAKSAQGDAWLCLRCGTYVPGKPQHTGPASAAPHILRGRSLREATILRVLAVERGIRAVGLLGIAYIIFRFHASQSNLHAIFTQDLPIIQSAAGQLKIDLDSSAIFGFIQDALNLKSQTLILVTILVAIYATVEGIEAVGLWLMRRWGEYFAVIATAAFIPYEVYELLRHATVIKGTAFAINVLAVAYLLFSKRLFGMRGGRQAYDQDHASESLLDTARAAVEKTSYKSSE